MNKIYSIAAAAFALASSLCLSSCATDEGMDGEGDGKLKLTVELQSDVVVTRAADTDASQDCKIQIYSSKGLVRQYKGLSQVPEDGIALVSGDYRVDVTAGDSVPASFDKKYYKGSTAFTITKGTTTAEVKCKIANVVASAKFDDSIDSMLKDYSLTVSNAGGSLTFTKEGADTLGYFMMDSPEDSLTYVLKGTKVSDGTEYSYTGSVKNPKSGYKYAMTVKYGDASLEEIGGAFITVQVDESEIVVEETHTLSMPPAYFADGFVFAEGLIKEPGAFTENMTLYVSSLGGLRSCTVSGSLLTALGAEDGSYDLNNESVREVLKEKNFSASYKTVKDKNQGLITIDVDHNKLNTLSVGEYKLYFSATDNQGKTSTGTLVLTLTNAYVTTQDAETKNINTYSATVTALIAKEGQTGYGIKYRKKGETNWTTAKTTTTGSTAGSTITAELSGLSANTTYEYVAVTDNYTDKTKTFTTLQALTIPNGDFESWSTSGNVQLIAPSSDDMFWDSGNHGSASFKGNITTPETSIKHGGNYSAKLASTYVVVKFAAGNLFVGKYLKTDGTNGVLGYGRPFKARPYALHGFVKYTPGTINRMGSGAPSDCVKGNPDKGIIYIAMLDGTTTTYDGTTWPCVIKTKSGELFSKSASNVLGYGEWSSTTATSGDGMIEFTIPIEYNNMNVVPSNMIICCAASAYGDYFSGSDSSVMYVDDFELLYK